MSEVLKPPCIVISQPMYFPWIGMLQQIQLADTFIYYDDVQFSKGSFSNRVQVKSSAGMSWMSVPLQNLHLGQLIQDVAVNTRNDWRRKHRNLLEQAYQHAPYRQDLLDLVDSVFSQSFHSLADLSHASTSALLDYFGLSQAREFYQSSSLNISGARTQRVLDICQAFQAKTYITGHGARFYLQHELFEQAGITVAYMDYDLKPYPQQHGLFTPYVTALDLVANCGPQGQAWLKGKTVPWRDFLASSERNR